MSQNPIGDQVNADAVMIDDRAGEAATKDGRCHPLEVRRRETSMPRFAYRQTVPRRLDV